MVDLMMVGSAEIFLASEKEAPHGLEASFVDAESCQQQETVMITRSICVDLA